MRITIVLGSASTIAPAFAILLALCSGAGASEAAKASTVQTEPQPPPWKPFNLYSLLDEASRVAEIERRHLVRVDVPAKVELLSRGIVAAPYLLSPLGEGAMPDPDPRLRFDAFDCTTFVETVLALLHCDDYAELEGMLDEIRYTDGAVDFQTRRHLMTSQWIPELIEAGYLKEVTRSIGGKKTKAIHLKLTMKRWKKRRIARTLVVDDEMIPTGTFELPYITIEDAMKIVKKFPAGAILNVVRKDVPGTPDVITHQGLLIKRPGEKRIYVRHASPVSKRVIDEPLARMLWRYTKPGRKWPIIGVNVLRVLPPKGAR